MIQIEYQLTPKDCLEAIQANVASSQKKKERWMNLLMAGITLFSALQWIWRSIDGSWAQIPGYTLTDAIFFSFIFPGLSILFLFRGNPKLNFLKRRSIERNWHRNCVISEYRTLSATETELIIAAESFRESRQWQHYVSFIQTERIFVLYYDRNLYHILPKRAFNSAEELMTFKDLIQKRIL
jgi:YcxB-like protein